jgi:hypothetical protein
VTAIGITTAPGGTDHAFLAIYGDGRDGPSDRVGEAQEVTLTGGTIEALVPHTTSDHTDLNPQSWYWVTAVSDANLVFLQCNGTAQWTYGALPFGAPPATLSAATVSLTTVPRDNSPSLFLKFAHPQ